MKKIPSDQHVTYQLQFRKCGKSSCSTCRNGQGHGPYWYAYWREGSRLYSGYIGKAQPGPRPDSRPGPHQQPSTPSASTKDTKVGIVLEDYSATAALM